MAAIKVESRIVEEGRLAPVLETINLGFLEEEISVADLIRRTVEEQIRLLRARLKLAGEAEEGADREIRERLARQYGPEVVREGNRIDTRREVEQAQESFRSGRIMILINGRPASSLEEELTFAPGTTVSFVRLTPLVGG